MDRLFRIGDFGFRILSELSCAAPAHFCQFGIETGVPEYIYRLREVPSLPVLDGKEIRLIGIRGQILCVLSGSFRLRRLSDSCIRR